MKRAKTKTTKRKLTAKDYCRTVVELMKPTHKGAMNNAILVCITKSLWTRIYANARQGAK